MDKLKPCPFCASESLSLKRNYQLDGMTFITCELCGLVVSFIGHELKKETIKAWNIRATDTLIEEN